MALVRLMRPDKKTVGVEPAYVTFVEPDSVGRWIIHEVGGGAVAVDFDGDLIEYLNGQQIEGTLELIESEEPEVRNRPSPKKK